MKHKRSALALLLACFGVAGCAARPTTSVRGIELEDPNERAEREASLGPGGSANAALVASGGGLSEADDSEFVHSRGPVAERAREVPQLPIHINDSWWSFRAQQLGVSEAQARTRDARMAESPPEDFWDAQTAVEAISVWTVLCNECHGGRRSVRETLDMPAPAANWGQGSGLFFGKRRGYDQMFEVVQNGVPMKEAGRVGMPAWRQILSNEMRWALLYFLEFQSGGIESRFPPSLYPRRPTAIGGR